MMKIIHQLFDLIFPTRDTEVLVRNITTTEINSLQKNGNFHGTVYLSDYQNKKCQALISENKFHQNALATNLLAKLLLKWTEQQNKQILFIPIPLSAERQRKRGYNQIHEVLKRLPSSKNFLVRTDILSRTKDTPPQTSLNKTKRLQNIIGAFSCSKDINYEQLSSTVVIVDDVVTTGATLAVARATLAPLLPPNTKLITLALAH